MHNDKDVTTTINKEAFNKSPVIEGTALPNVFRTVIRLLNNTVTQYVTNNWNTVVFFIPERKRTLNVTEAIFSTEIIAVLNSLIQTDNKWT